MPRNVTVAFRTQEEALALLQDTVEFYWPDPMGRRAVGGGGYEYETDDGRRCPVGRHLINPRSATTHGMNGVCSIRPSVLEKRLKPESRGYPKWMWHRLQNLHDFSDNWSACGLSRVGENAVKEITALIRKRLPAS